MIYNNPSILRAVDVAVCNFFLSIIFSNAAMIADIDKLQKMIFF